MDLEALDTLVQIRSGMSGQARLAWQAGVDGSEYRVESHVEIPALHVVGFGLSQVSGEVLVSQDGIEGSLRSARFAGGTVSGTYSLDGFGAPWRHRVVDLCLRDQRFWGYLPRKQFQPYQHAPKYGRIRQGRIRLQLVAGRSYLGL